VATAPFAEGATRTAYDKTAAALQEPHDPDAQVIVTPQSQSVQQPFCPRQQ
jgi:hypothetical protein